MTTPTLSVSAVLLAVATLHSLGLAIALARSRRRPRQARLVLVALTLVITVLLAQMVLVFSEIKTPARAIVGSLWLAIAPLYFLYIRSLQPNRSLTLEDIVHSLPILFHLGVLGVFYTAPVVDAEAYEAGRPVLGFALLLLYGLQTLLYAPLTWHLVESLVVRYRREAAGPEAERVTGLRVLSALFAVYALALTVNIVVLTQRGSLIAWLDFLVPLALAAIVWAIGYGLLRRPERVLPALVLPPEPMPAKAPEAAPTPEALGLASALREHLRKDQPYLNPDVRLSDIARHLGVTERTVSQILNDAFAGTFYDVMNGYRVEEAQARLADPKYAHLTVLAVGMDAGFSSKATYNRVFKKTTGETPSAYRRRMSEPLASVSGDGSMREITPL